MSSKLLKQIIEKYFFIGKPVDRAECLRGRLDELDRIETTFNQTSKSVFILGERGVGKSSLARTAGYLYTDIKSEKYTEQEFIYCVFSPSEKYTMRNLISNCILQLAKILKTQRPKIDSGIEVVISGNPSLKFTRKWYETSNETDIPFPKDMSETISLLSGFSQLIQSNELVIVFDELEQIKSDEDRTSLANFIKQIGDQGLSFRFIFVGIGQTLTDIFGAHNSVPRYIQPIVIKKLNEKSLNEIITIPAEKLSLNIHSNHLDQIYELTEGLPYFCHEMGPELLQLIIKDGLKDSQDSHIESCFNSLYSNLIPIFGSKYDDAVDRGKKIGGNLLYSITHIENDTPSLEDIVSNYSKFAMTNGLPRIQKGAIKSLCNNLCKDDYGAILIALSRNRFSFSDPQIKIYCKLKFRDFLMSRKAS